LVVASGARHAPDEITFTDDACEGLTQVPKMFRKMALKTIIKGAKSKAPRKKELPKSTSRLPINLSHKNRQIGKNYS